MPKKIGANQRGNDAAQLLVDPLGQDRRLTHQHAGDKGAQHRVDPDGVGRERHQPHHDEDQRDHGQVADEVVVGPAHQPRDEAPAERRAHHHEHGDAAQPTARSGASRAPPAGRGRTSRRMMIHPTVSSMIAEATMIWPRLRRMKCISSMTIATILIEEIDSAVPRKSDVTSRFSGAGSRLSGSR